MAKPNYQFEKRQRDLAKKAKQEEKRRNKLAGKSKVEDGGGAVADPPAAEAALPDIAAPEAPTRA